MPKQSIDRFGEGREARGVPRGTHARAMVWDGVKRRPVGDGAWTVRIERDRSDGYDGPASTALELAGPAGPRNGRTLIREPHAALARVGPMHWVEGIKPALTAMFALRVRNWSLAVLRTGVTESLESADIYKCLSSLSPLGVLLGTSAVPLPHECLRRPPPSPVSRSPGPSLSPPFLPFCPVWAPFGPPCLPHHTPSPSPLGELREKVPGVLGRKQVVAVALRGVVVALVDDPLDRVALLAALVVGLDRVGARGRL